jgi:hypothetical protein
MKWEYKMIQIPGRPEKAIGELNLLGSEGWEAISAWADRPTRHFSTTADSICLKSHWVRSMPLIHSQRVRAIIARNIGAST